MYHMELLPSRAIRTIWANAVTPILLTAALCQPLLASIEVSLTTAQIAKRVSPGVVSIEGNTDSGGVIGSGFIVSKDGKIVTNLHVIRGLKTAEVHLGNGEAFDTVSVLATDERRDLAIIQVAGFDLPTLELGNSNNVTVGESVVVVGTPRGLEGTVTAGILSSVRESDGSKVLQTDAAVNPGNSGSPLVNDRGQTIGVVSFKLRSAEGLNFAIPINYVKGLLNNVHGPISLEDMRRELESTHMSSDTKEGGPSLSETLQWLQAKVALANVERPPLKTWTTPISIESCRMTTDEGSRLTFPDRTMITIHARYTIPLGAVSSARLLKKNLGKGESGADVYWVVIDTTAPVILVERYSDNVASSSETVSEAELLPYSDQPLAERVVKALLHASELCREPEAF
jgi:S1-C subfamily serine protease